MVRSLAPLALVVALATAAAAATADEAAGRAHYQAAQAYFDQAKFADALREYEESYRLTPYPAILYRIGLCKEQLGDYGGAADALAEYLQRDATTTRRAAVESSIARLRQLAAPPPGARETPAAPSPPVAPRAATSQTPPTAAPAMMTTSAPPVERRARRPWLMPTLVLGGAVVLAGAGAALVGSVAADFGSCLHPCSNAQITSMEGRAYAGYALFGLAGGAAIVDVALWIRLARHRHREVASK